MPQWRTPDPMSIGREYWPKQFSNPCSQKNATRHRTQKSMVNKTRSKTPNSKSHRISCAQCGRPSTMCYCKTLIVKENTWPIYILQTEKESKHALNTGRMAQLSLANCEITVVQHPNDIAALLERLPQQPLLVFPAQDSHDVGELKGYISPAPFAPLLFIDATWRKAKRMLHESPELQHLPKFFLTPESQAYRLRSAKKHSSVIKDRSVKPLSTIEAIEQILSLLEGRDYESMLNTLSWVLDQQSQYIKD